VRSYTSDETLTGAVGVDATQLRSVCGHFVTGVTIVTSVDGQEPVGLTVNSFTSVSLDPPLILFCLHRASSVRRAILATKCFTVNILAEAQHDLSRRFATRGVSRFSAVPYSTGSNGAPVLQDALAHVSCRLIEELQGGDHVIVLGEVTDVGIIDESAAPLTFFRGSHRRLAA
jgi:flavin reductase (DIM6/NTAB) family NADH-FMN oxidoreductase RutF